MKEIITKDINYKIPKEGEYHIIYKRDNNKIDYEEYYLNGECHRDNNLPAYISYYLNGKIYSEIYFLNGLIHRDNNLPAIISYYENGTINSEKYYLNGIQYSKEDYIKQLRILKIKKILE